MNNKPFFYIYAIRFDEECFGIFSTREAAQESLDRQSNEGGPAWDDCEVIKTRVWGKPEIGTS